jgi:hypothetical protein
MKTSSAFVAGLFAALCANPLAAMEAPAAEPIEEITVTGQRLRMKVSEAEDAMYALFNDLNTDDRYDIVCTMEVRVFSHIRQKRCVPQYARDALMEEAQSMVRGQPGMPSQAVMAYHSPRLEAKFQEMVGESQELFEAVARHYELNEAWRLRRKAYFGDANE